MKKDAFTRFYKESARRLTKEINRTNRKMRKEKNPIIETMLSDVADLNEGGKLLRGIFVLLGYRIAKNLAGGETRDTSYADGAAVAFELFQTGVLIHDDIIDNADTRRGKTTIQRRYEGRLAERKLAYGAAALKTGESAAICAGDYGLYLANLTLAEAYAGDPCLAELIRYFDTVILDTIRGELLDVMLPVEIADPALAPEEAAELRRESILSIYKLKTAQYSVVGPLHLGMILGGASKKAMRDLDAFAENLGIAFQIKDDILGVFADADVLGKDVGSDIEEKKQTVLSMYVENEAPEYASKLAEIYGKPDADAEAVEAVRTIFRESGALSFAESEMEKLFSAAERKLSAMKDLMPEDRAVLTGLITYMRGRKK